MASVPNSRKGSAGENWEQETRSANTLQRKQQQPTETQPGSNREESSDTDTMNRSELVSNCHYLSTDPTATDDNAILTDNRTPSPISPETVPGSVSIHQKPHQDLILKVSQESHVSVPINGEQRTVVRVKSVTTKGGRVIRNIGMNNSVKYNMASAQEKYSSAFSSYKNVFRPGSIKDGEQQKPSVKRDGQVRRNSRQERTHSERSLSTSSEENVINGNTPSKLVHQESSDSCTSVTSNTQLVTNPYNVVNHKISSVVWCPCFFFFCFFCCLPALRFMNRSDVLFNDGHYDKARTYARISTALYVLGMILSIAFLSAIFAVILIFAV